VPTSSMQQTIQDFAKTISATLAKDKVV
jgi:hypothetical protein